MLNVGFGMGIVDAEIQKHNPRTHTIIEAHPDVIASAKERGWGDKPGVRLVQGRWQDVIDELGPFDGIFFDTYGEFAEDMREFHERLPKCVRAGERGRLGGDPKPARRSRAPHPRRPDVRPRGRRGSPRV